MMPDNSVRRYNREHVKPQVLFTYLNLQASMNINLVMLYKA